MKLDPDCIRSILLIMESTPHGKGIPFQQVLESLPKYSTDDISYSILKMREGGLIRANLSAYDNEIQVYKLLDITYDGHQFLAEIRDNKIWGGIKSVSKEVGANSISALTMIASEVVTSLIKSYFGLA